MRHTSSFLFRVAGLALAIVSVSGQSGPKMSREEFSSRMNEGLDKVEQAMSGKANNKLVLSANLFFAHGAAVKHFSIDVLNAYADGLKASGATRIDINPSVQPFANSDQEIVRKYDELVRHIRSLGMQLAINPEFNQNEMEVKTLADWQERAVRGYTVMAQKYKPEVFNLIHEPTTMARRMHIGATPQEWRTFVEVTGEAVRRASPGSRLSAGGLAQEQQYLREFAGMPMLDAISVNIYNLGALTTYNKLIAGIKKTGKGVYIGETWRNPYVDLGGKQPENLERYISSGTGDSSFESLDARWIQAMVKYASGWGMESITPFWTQTFFLYEPGAGGLDPKYNAAVGETLKARRCTSVCQKYQQLAREYGRR